MAYRFEVRALEANVKKPEVLVQLSFVKRLAMQVVHGLC